MSGTTRDTYSTNGTAPTTVEGNTPWKGSAANERVAVQQGQVMGSAFRRAINVVSGR